MRIGIDVDGVLTHLEEYQLKYGKKYFLKKNPNLVINENAYDICDIFHCTREEREKFWTKYIWGYCLNDPIRLDAKQVIQKLKADGHEIHIITGRSHTTENGPLGSIFRKMLIHWLKKNDIPYDSIHFVSESGSALEKFNVCKELNIDIMVEDKVENIEAIKEIADVVCISTKWNQDIVDTEKVHKTSTLWSAYKIIKKISDPNAFIPKTTKEKLNMTLDEKIKYNESMVEYYKSLPFDKEHNKKMERNYILSLKVGLPFFKLAYKPLILDRENLTHEKGVIYVSNHLGSLDQFPIMCAVGSTPTHYLAASTLLPLKRGLLYRKTGCIFVDREDKDSKADSVDKLAQYVVNGTNVFMFPEGTRNRTGKFMLDFKPGAVSLAQTTGAKIVPFAVNNNYKIGGNNLMVRCGKPMEIKPEDDVIEKTEELRDYIASMIWQNMELEEEVKTKKLKRK